MGNAGGRVARVDGGDILLGSTLRGLVLGSLRAGRGRSSPARETYCHDEEDAGLVATTPWVDIWGVADGRMMRSRAGFVGRLGSWRQELVLVDDFDGDEGVEAEVAGVVHLGEGALPEEARPSSYLLKREAAGLRLSRLISLSSLLLLLLHLDHDGNWGCLGSQEEWE
ncbi:uncharacterized protein A4U43_C05F17140 [Asparagus officinalis]|uniref:Uncharacterized protein n=1 Tax=Asparagus officinalis TaxID=4686 RepID=A0A5P1ET96_ASPOF|nr:uncharacterized protein A4U43_C05F17140 [Asparagus officinalis]